MLCTKTITLIRCANKGISTLHTHSFLGYGTDQIFFPLCDPLGKLLHFSALVHLFALTINISEFYIACTNKILLCHLINWCLGGNIVIKNP